MAVPGGNLLRTRRELGTWRNGARLQLIGVDYVPVLVPTHVKAPSILAAPIQRRLVWSMSRPGREVGEKRAIRRNRLLLANPTDALVGEITGELVALFGSLWRLDGLGVADE